MPLQAAFRPPVGPGERILRNFSPIEPLNQWATSNIQHPTSNIECRRDRKFRCSLDVRRWMLDVGCSWRFMGRVAEDPGIAGNPAPRLIKSTFADAFAFTNPVRMA